MYPVLSDGFDSEEREVASFASGLECLDKSRAIQSQREESDINEIVRRFGLSGELPVARRVPLDVSDFSDGDMDYRESLDAVRAADLSFLSLPASVRESFGNDPARFVDFAVLPESLPQMRLWGLAPPAEAQPAEPDVPA